MRESKDSEERKDEFIDAAEKLFKENGIVDTTVNAIVKEMDVAKGLFDYYFKSKDDVIDAISEKYNTDFKESIRKSMNQDDFDSRLDQFIENSIVSFKNMWGKLHPDSEDIDLSILSNRSVDEAKKIAVKALQGILEEGNRIGKLAVKNAKGYAEILISGICDLTSKEDADIEEIKSMIEDLISKSRKE